ncbi:MAG: glycosyltransferase family 4 protein [Planctomycetaceae bacterium]|nr:MAG: glycosyltransferase family 4 protein [Planctomycetaceae bacterium]
MKIVMFTNTYLPHVSGVARSVETFSDDLRTLGHEIHVVCPTFQGATKSTDTILRVPAIQNFNGSDFSVRIPLPGAISRHLHEFRPDLIHAHHPFFLGDAALRTARKLGRPLVFTHHTMYEDYTHYVPVDQQLLRQFVVRLSTDYANLCDHVIAPSESVADLLRQRGVESPITVIPTGVDLALFSGGNGRAMRERLGIPPGSKVIGHLGRLAPEKNLDFLAEAIARYLCHDAGAESCCLMVGSGTSQEQIEKTFRDRGVADRLYMPGRRTGRELADAYAAMDLFVFASKTETQGMVLAEAMAAGKPVIALDAPGAREVVYSDEVGRLLDGDADMETFADALAEFPLAGDAYDKHAAAARERARMFSREQCSRRLVGVYEQLDRQARRDAGDEQHTAWDSLLVRLQTEWELLAAKTHALIAAAEGQSDAKRVKSDQAT